MSEELDRVLPDNESGSHYPKWIQWILKLNWLDYSVKLCLVSAVAVGVNSSVILCTSNEAKPVADFLSHLSTISGSIGAVGVYFFGKPVVERIAKQLSIQTSTLMTQRMEQFVLEPLPNRFLKIGDKIPRVELVEGSIKTTTTDVCAGKKVVLLALLGTHDKIKSNLKHFVERANSFKEKDVQDNICVIMSAPNPEEQTTAFTGSDVVRVLFDRNSEFSKKSCAMLLEDETIICLEFERENLADPSLVDLLYAKM